MVKCARVWRSVFFSFGQRLFGARAPTSVHAHARIAVATHCKSPPNNLSKEGLLENTCFTRGARASVSARETARTVTHQTAHTQLIVSLF